MDIRGPCSAQLPFPVLPTVVSSYISCPTLWPCLFRVTGLCALFGLSSCPQEEGSSIPLLLVAPSLRGNSLALSVIHCLKMVLFCLF